MFGSSRKSHRHRNLKQRISYVEPLEPRVLMATRIWDGGGALTNDRWTTARNWQGDVAPQPGDDLVFPAGVSENDLNNRNNFPDGTLFSSITVSSGDPVRLNGNRVRLGASGFKVTSDNPNVFVRFDIELTSAQTNFQVNGRTLLEEKITGSGGIRKSGAGLMFITGSERNTFTGTTTVDEGELRLTTEAGGIGVNAIGGPLVINQGVVSTSGGGQLPNTRDVTINPAALFAVEDGVEGVGSLTVNGGRVFLGEPATLVVGGNLQSNGDSLINGSGHLSLNKAVCTFDIQSGRLRVGPRIEEGGIIKRGPGILEFLTIAGTAGNASNTYSGATTVEEGTLLLRKSGGQTAINGPLVVNGGVVELAGPDQINNAVISNSTDVTLAAPGLLDLRGFNESIRTLAMTGGRIETGTGTLTITRDQFGVGGFVTVNPAPGSAVINGRLALSPDFRRFDVANGQAAIDLAVNALVVDGADAGGIRKIGLGAMRLSGDNTYSGSTTIEQGALLINGNQPLSDVSLDGGTLAGNGTLGSLETTGGILSPGGNETAALKVASAHLQSGVFRVQLNGTVPAAQFDRLTVGGGPVALDDFPRLDASLNFDSAVDDTFAILINQGAQPITGLFRNGSNVLDNLETFFIDGQAFVINYAGGSGNDVVLRHVNTPPAFKNIRATSPIEEGGKVTLQGRITEPDRRDTFFLDVDWGDGSPLQTFVFPPGSDPNVSVSHRYRDDNPSGTSSDKYSIGLLWRDQHGASNTGRTSVEVKNVDPLVSAGANVIAAGLSFQQLGSFTDPGRDQFTATVDYGDGSGQQALQLDAEGRFRVAHTYAEAGTYFVVVRVRDDDGGLGVDVLRVTVGESASVASSDALFAALLSDDGALEE